jgi:predicted ABC-type ATPase
MANGDPTFWLIAGPNGVGKTTYAMRHLRAVSGSVNFVNLDEIARGLSPLEPSAAQTDAARIALSRAHDFIEGRRTFAMETTLSGLAHLRLLAVAREAGLRTAMLYFSVISPDICLERIARRVAEGGHDVAEPIVRRRFERSARNLARYAAACDLWRVYEASGARPRLALEGKRGGVLDYRDDQALADGHAALRELAESS